MAPPLVLALVLFLGSSASAQDLARLQIGGVYPHLAVSNAENECGIGAVVPWAGKLWVVTYAPHRPMGSTDKLYSINDAMGMDVFPGSVGGTPANRMIHRETKQLLIGPYVIRDTGEVRVIPPSRMYGRLTGNARHLLFPETKAYYATMEEGLYEVDLVTLAVHCLIRDENKGAPDGGAPSVLQGYHGKGLYSGQGQVVYSNNGEYGRQAMLDPTTSSGALATWSLEADEGEAWSLVRRNQFTEVTGPGGIYGSDDPENDPIWTLGWDVKSILLGVMQDGAWSYYRLPKASHSYDGAHGWNTEWPRIRDIGEGEDLLATMHGTFWRFPKGFRKGAAKGIRPRSNYLKVVGDFCAHEGRVVLGCDDSAKAEFLNKRPFKSEAASPLESNSNLWFIDPERLDQLGPAIGRGSVWLREDVAAGVPSDPYLLAGYEHRQLCLTHGSPDDVDFLVEIDADGTNEWSKLTGLSVGPGEARFYAFGADLRGEWVRVTVPGGARAVTAHFQYRCNDPRNLAIGALFDGVARVGAEAKDGGGLMRSLAHDRLGLLLPADEGEESRYYELGPDLIPTPSDDREAESAVRSGAQPAGSYAIDGHSLLVIEDGERYRLPLGVAPDTLVTPTAQGRPRPRVCREVATERDLLNVAGTVFELPARNASGVSKIRPIATHGLAIQDFCSHAGLLFLTGIDADAESPRIFRSRDGEAAVWAGVIDDLWTLGRPRGEGGPWTATKVDAGEVSDRYLMTGYDKKSASLSSDAAVSITLEVDIDGTNLWVPYGTYEVDPGRDVSVTFPHGLSAYWVRARASGTAAVTVSFSYR